MSLRRMPVLLPSNRAKAQESTPIQAAPGKPPCATQDSTLGYNTQPTCHYDRELRPRKGAEGHHLSRNVTWNQRDGGIFAEMMKMTRRVV